VRERVQVGRLERSGHEPGLVRGVIEPTTAEVEPGYVVEDH
jgi:hypothetical protein